MAKKKDPNSKMTAARKIMKNNLRRKHPLARKDVIAKFESEVGLTKQGAASYYYRLSKELKA